MSATGEWAEIISNLARGICTYPSDRVHAAAAREYMASFDHSGWIEGGGHCPEDRDAIEEMLAGTPLEGDTEIVDYVCAAIDEMVAEALADQVRVWITGEVTGRAHLTEEPQTSDDYVEYRGTPLELLERVCSLYKQGKQGSSWSIDAAVELETFLVGEGHLDGEWFCLELNDEEKALFEQEDGQGYWWRADDTVNLNFHGEEFWVNSPRVSLELIRRTGPWELPEVWGEVCPDDCEDDQQSARRNEWPGGVRSKDWEEWCDLYEMPRSIRMRMWECRVVRR